MANERANALSGQFIIDGHTHFLRDDTRLLGFVKMREAVGKAGWNKELSGKEQTIDDLKYGNYIKEIYMDSDTKVALLSNSPSDVPEDWFIPQAQVFKTREKVNKKAGITADDGAFHVHPGPARLARARSTRRSRSTSPNSWKGYTVGDNTHKELAHWPWHADDEKLMYPFYEKMAKSGIKNVCIHKGLFAPAVAEKFPRLRPYADVSDIGKAAKDWPQLNFLVYHSAYRWVGGNPAEAMAEFDKTGRSSWTSDLAEIPEKYGVTNVYGDLGQIFAWTAVAEPRLAAALMGMLVKGLGPDHIVWGTDAVWTGAPQWQIEGLRRLEIPEDMQKKYGFKPLGPADGPVKTAIFSGNRRGSTSSSSMPNWRGTTASRRSRRITSQTAAGAAICATAMSAIPAEPTAGACSTHSIIGCPCKSASTDRLRVRVIARLVVDLHQQRMLNGWFVCPRLRLCRIRQRLARSKPMAVICMVNGSSIVALTDDHVVAHRCRKRGPSTPSRFLCHAGYVNGISDLPGIADQIDWAVVGNCVLGHSSACPSGGGKHHRRAACIVYRSQSARSVIQGTG